MRNKSTIIVLLSIFSAICLFNLFMTYRAFSMESELNNATAEAADVMRREEGFKESYEFAQRNAFSLGLDLQGGLFVTMEVGTEDILRQFAGDAAAEPEFVAALDTAIKKKVTSQDDLVDLFYESLQEVYTAKKMDIPVNLGVSGNPKILLAHYFSGKELEVGATDPDADVIAKLKDRTEAAINNTYTIVRSRIDQFGVASPNLQLQKGTGRILLELPGVKDPTRVKNLLRNSAKLEFRETVSYREAYTTIDAIDKVVKRLTDLEAGIVTAPTPATPDTTKPDSGVAVAPAVATPDSPAVGSADTANNGGVEDLFSGKNDSAVASNDSAGSDSTGDPTQDLAKLKREHPFKALFDLKAQVVTAERPLIGLVALADTGAVSKWLRHPDVKAVIPFTMKFLWEAKPDADRDPSMKNELGLIGIRTNREDKAPLEGDVVIGARQDYEPNTTNAMVSMTMNSEGGAVWQRITKDNMGKCVAIVLDDYVQTYPTIQSVISGGRSQITGNFTVDEAKDLANLLKAGALPVKAKILGDSLVGPTMGAENLSKGLVSFVVAFLAVIAFMAYYYRGAGLVANVALLVNLFYIFGVSAALNIVFTLPGLAAVVLTMGMAVDANVLVFERIREEQALGKSYKAAVAAGFKSAFGTIMDSNITTFLTGLILFWFGMGPIAGFAVNLMIGIATSLICSLFLTRLLLEWIGERNSDGVTFGSKFTLTAFNHFDIKMTKRKKYFYVYSGGLSLLCMIFVFTFGFKTGVEFDGGTQVKVQFSQPVSTEAIRGPLAAAFDNKSPLIREISGSDMMLITTSYNDQSSDGGTEVNKMITEVLEKAAPGSNPEIIESSVVGPSVASDIKRAAIYSVVFSLLAIGLYILIRFRRYQYSIGAIASLIHDVSIVMGLFALFGRFEILPFSLEIDQAFIAAILTVIGFSINDTVIVFDRIRENLHEMKSSPLGVIYDESINRVFSRTVITSGTVLLTALVMFFFGGDVIRPFMFALLIGIGVGTYSSIFVASPIAYDMIRAVEGENREKVKAEAPVAKV